MTQLILRYCLELAIVIPAAVFALLPVSKYLKSPSTGFFIFVGGVLFLLIIPGGYFCAMYGLDSNYLIIPCMIPFFLFYHLSLDLSVSKKLFCFFNAAMLSSYCTLLTLLLMVTTEIQDESGPFFEVSGILCLAIASFIGFLFFKTLTVKIPLLLQERSLDNSWKYVCLIPLGITCFFIWVCPNNLSLLLNNKLRLISISVMSFFLLIIFIYYNIFWRIVRHMRASTKLMQENNVLQLEKKRYYALRNYVDRTRAIRHDFRQHVLVLTQLSDEGETQKLNTYLHELTDDASISEEVFSANPAVDAMASYYNAQARAKQIDIDWVIELPEVLPIRMSDYCSILGNLMENAILAVSSLPEEKRKINVTTRMLSNAMIGLSVENPYSGKLRFKKNGLPKTKKKHGGTGLSSVYATVQKYHGAFDLNTENNVFYVGILLYV